MNEGKYANLCQLDKVSRSIEKWSNFCTLFYHHDPIDVVRKQAHDDASDYLLFKACACYLYTQNSSMVNVAQF